MICPGPSLTKGLLVLGERIFYLIAVPFSLIFTLIVRLRNYLFDVGLLRSTPSILPVISVGNLTVGGNGKTPTVMWLASELIKLGFKPVILSRGYGGSSPGPLIVQVNAHPSLVGDEPLMMTRRGICPVVIAKRRVAGALLIAQSKLGDVILLDDGFQHRWLARDLDLVVANISSERNRTAFVAGRLLPAGRFRESRDEALERAGAIIFINRVAAGGGDSQFSACDVPLEIQGSHTVKLPVFNARFIPRRIVEVDTRKEAPTAELAGRQVVAVCALGQPEAFFSTLEELGAQVVARQAFRDHAPIPLTAIADLRGRFPKAILVCTEKDAVKIAQHQVQDLWYLEIDIIINGAQELLPLVTSAIDRKVQLA